MCKVGPEEKLQSLSILLQGDAINFFSNNMGDYYTSEEAELNLKRW